MSEPVGPAAATVAGSLRWAAEHLAAAGVEEPRREARLLLALATGIGRERQLGDPDRQLQPAAVVRLEELVGRRQAREPMAYIRGSAPFWDFELAIRPGVLVPRPETEVLIEAATVRATGMDVARILDLGTGSGCIVLALLRQFPQATGTGLDRSPAALACAAENARQLGLEGRLHLVAGDWAAAPPGPYELIVANPPYVADGELAGLQPEVRDYEPRLALAGGTDGLDPYRILAPLAATLSARSGLVAFEHGAGQAEAVAALLSAAGFVAVQHHRDLAGIRRCVTARRP